MKVSDYIVEYLIRQQITDIYGYPGGMVTHFMDSLRKYADQITTHITYHEQGASFAACGYAQASDKVGVAFATSGPGATNLITGICNAYFDSIPVVFITGQVNTFESKGDSCIRQKGFQETDIVSMVKKVSKEAIYVKEPNDIIAVLERAFQVAMEGRKGPVVLDIPMNIFRAEIEAPQEEQSVCAFSQEESCDTNGLNRLEETLMEALGKAKRPCLLIGNGIKISGQVESFRKMVRECHIPVVSSMLSVDVIPEEDGLEGIYYGFVGAYGNRTANFVAAKSDLVICLGSRLDVRQVGGKRENFAPQARIIRVDIDPYELENVIRPDESSFCISVEEAIPVIQACLQKMNCEKEASDYSQWLEVCKEIKNHIKYIDEKEPNKIVNLISRQVKQPCAVVADVGQNMVWVAQSYKMREQNRVYMSGGHGAMGYALPAAIGIYHATHRPVICFCGDGGIQMNIQELQLLAREQLPIWIVILNNHSLGMIRHFQEMYFESNYFCTTESEGYTVPDFVAIAKAYGIEADWILGENRDKLQSIFGQTITGPKLLEIQLQDNTVVSPKLEFGKPNQDQEPLLDRELYQYLMGL